MEIVLAYLFCVVIMMSYLENLNNKYGVINPFEYAMTLLLAPVWVALLIGKFLEENLNE